VYAMDLSDGVWTLLREPPYPDFSLLDFSQRFTGTFSSGGQTRSTCRAASRRSLSRSGLQAWIPGRSFVDGGGTRACARTVTLCG
jgi:hypothetical protein